MKKLAILPALLITAVLTSAPSFATEVPDTQLQSEARDATLVTSPAEERIDKNASPLNVFVNTLLGKNIDPASVKQENTKR